MTTMESLLNMPPFAGYLYAYPHKTAYRSFDPPLDLRQVWQDERKEQLFLYVHIPFCEMRCGFCNLFTMTGAKGDAVSGFMDALMREAASTKQALGDARFSQIAIGGGTPTFLSIKQLERLFDGIHILTTDSLPISIETSPTQATPERLKFLQERGITRISVGVESFSSEHLRAMGRPAQADDTPLALDSIRKLTDANLNIDLIYGAQGQGSKDFCADIKSALAWQPEEIFIYPLYVGQLTGLARTKAVKTATDDWDAKRLAQYRAGRDMLLDAGYRQMSMRRFVRGKTKPASNYSCQEDGMVGLGTGARSYTSTVHYSSGYAVGRAGIKNIIQSYTDEADFTKIRHGIRLSLTEQKIRYVIKSILNADGLDLARYQFKFNTSALQDMPKLNVLIEAGYLMSSKTHLTPTTLGFERADAMGPFLISPAIKETMGAYQWV